MRSIKIFCKGRPAKDTYVFGSRFSASFPAALFSCFTEIKQQNDSMCQPAIGWLGLEYKQNDNTKATCMCQGVNEGIKYF
jgi:hypothetical protein